MKKGFSLGEAIAVLAVVGVVAMLTLPILVRKTQDSANISRLQKAYKGLVDAVGSWMVDDRISDITSSSYITTHPDLFIARYIKTYNQSSESTDGLLSGCYRDRNSHQFNINFVNSYSCAKLANGSTLCLTPYNTEEYIVLYGCGNTRTVTGTRKVNKTMLKSEYCAAYPTASICGATTEDREVCALSQSMFADLVTKVFEYKNEGEEEGDRHTHKKVLQMLKTKGIDKVAEDEEYCNMLENDFGNEFFKQMMDEIVNDTKWGQKMHKDSNVKNLFEKWKESGEEDLIHIMGSEDRPCGHTEFSLNILTKNSVIQYATKVVFTGNGEGSGEGGLDEEKIEKLGQGIIDKILSNIPYEEFIEDKEMCCTAYQTVYGEHLECPIQETVTVAGCVPGNCPNDSTITVEVEEEYEYEEELEPTSAAPEGEGTVVAQNKVHANSTDVPLVEVVLDTNGPSLPNKLGSDLFIFYIYRDGFIGVRSNDTSKTNCYMNQYYQCFKSLYNNDWKMPY